VLVSVMKVCRYQSGGFGGGQKLPLPYLQRKEDLYPHAYPVPFFSFGLFFRVLTYRSSSVGCNLSSYCKSYSCIAFYPVPTELTATQDVVL